MALAVWARTAAGTNLAFVKGFGKALKSWKEVLQQTILRKGPPKPPKNVELPQARERCLNQPLYQIRSSEKLQSRVFKSLFSRSTNMTLAAALRRRAANELSSTGNAGARNFRSIPLLSLIGVTLGLDISDLIKGNSEKVMSEMREMFQDYGWQAEPLEQAPNSLEDLDIIHNSIAAGCEGAVYKARVKKSNADKSASSDGDFNLAVKAVFNYGAESSASHILRELHREMVPLNSKSLESTENSKMCPTVGRLPPHPNIVDMPGIFVDDVLVTEEGLKNFPAAMPHKLNPEQFYGRNKTLYLVMRRRSTHLRDYLATHEVTIKTRCLILAQILEGVSHLVNHGIAHRDLKTDNILVDVPKTGDVPKVEICDFGCCLAEEDRSLKVNYPSRDLFLGGNTWLMAPEIATAVPGRNSVLDYRKSDVWAVGALAYEIFGVENPFYPSKDNSRRQLSSRNYFEDSLPNLPDEVPAPVKKLVNALLIRDPKKRPSASMAATVVQMAVMDIDKCLVTPNQYKTTKGKKPVVRKTGCKPQLMQAAKEREMLQGVVIQSLTLLCQLMFGQGKESWDVESVARFLFLSRLNYQDFRDALYFF